MRIYYKCHPIRDLRVIPAANIITRACLAPCFFYGMSRYHTIPSKLSCGNVSKLYELNVWAMTCGRAKERTVSVQNELAAKREGTNLRPMRSAAWHDTLVTVCR